MAAPTSQIPPRFRSRAYGNVASNRKPVPPTFRRDTVDPIITPRTRKRSSPFVPLLLVLAGIVAVFGAGNLPQLSAFFDNANSSARATNDTVVNTVISAGPIILVAAIAFFFLLMLALWRNAVRRRESDG